jgi:hypothetical protein
MDKIAAYEALLLEHPLWADSFEMDKEAAEDREPMSARNKALLASAAALGTGAAGVAGARYLRNRRAAEAAKNMKSSRLKKLMAAGGLAALGSAGVFRTGLRGAALLGGLGLAARAALRRGARGAEDLREVGPPGALESTARRALPVGGGDETLPLTTRSPSSMRTERSPSSMRTERIDREAYNPTMMR